MCLRLYGCMYGRPDVLDRIKLRTITNQLSIIVNILFHGNIVVVRRASSLSPLHLAYI